MPERMWFINSRDKEVKGDQVDIFTILNGFEKNYRNMFFSLKKDSRTRGKTHEVRHMR